MARYGLIVALGMVAAAAPVSAANQDEMQGGRAPAASPDAVYCLKAEPITGSRIPTIACLTREEWAEGDVDVDKVWARDGVEVIEGARAVS